MNSMMRRRSYRRFLDRPVEREKIESIMRAAMQSPTGRNAQGWEFLIVTGEDMRVRVSEMSDVTVSAKNAPVLIIPMSNMQKAVGDKLLWSCDMGAVCQTILLQIEEEGLGGCWLSCWPYEHKVKYLQELFSLPEHMVPYAVISCGYKAEQKGFDNRYDPEKVHWERY